MHNQDSVKLRSENIKRPGKITG